MTRPTYGTFELQHREITAALAVLARSIKGLARQVADLERRVAALEAKANSGPRIVPCARPHYRQP